MSAKMRILMAATVLGSTASIASAQSNPSADQILNSLRPGAAFTGGTRGIRPTAPAAEVSPQAPPNSVTPAAHRTATPATHSTSTASSNSDAGPSVNLNVQFASGSADLTPAAVRTLNELGKALSNPALSGSHFRIEGHTDTAGNADENKALSSRRAATVVDYLVQHFHLDRDKLEPVGMGEEGLLVQTGPNTPDIRNRRVQVINTGA